eukprot:1182184-Prorocentrum_minimum.AAC.7
MLYCYKCDGGAANEGLPPGAWRSSGPAAQRWSRRAPARQPLGACPGTRTRPATCARVALSSLSSPRARYAFVTRKAPAGPSPRVSLNRGMSCAAP